MGNLRDCCIRDKAILNAIQDEGDLENLLSSKPPEITLTFIPYALSFLEKNTDFFDTKLKFEFTGDREPYDFPKFLQTLEYNHFYKRFSFTLGPFLKTPLACSILVSLQSMNCLEVVELYLGKNNDLGDVFLENLALLVKNSICFSLKIFKLELINGSFGKVEALIKALFERDSLRDIYLNLCENNLNDDDFELILQLLDKKELKKFGLDANNNHGHEKAAQKLTSAMNERKEAITAILRLKENRFNPGDKKKIAETAEMKKNQFIVEL